MKSFAKLFDATTPARTLATCVLLSSVISATASLAASDNLLKIPNGYQSGRADATYGTYSSVVSESGRSLQTRLANLENRIMGFAQLSNEDRVKQSETLFVLEQAALKLHLDIANSPAGVATDFERAALLYGSVRAYQSLRYHGERLFEDMVRYIDVQLPGPNGLQFRSELADTLESTYLPNYRSDNQLTDADRTRLYAEKVKEFTGKGGSLSEIKLLNPDLVNSMGPYTRVEYVVRANNEIYVSEGNAGHILLAEGGATKAGGQMIFLKDNQGRVSMAVISNSSGSFKPDMFSLLSVKAAIVKMTGVSQENVVLTKGEPLSTQAVKVYSKGMDLPKDLTKERIARLNRMEKDLRKLALPQVAAAKSCRAIFSSN